MPENLVVWVSLVKFSYIKIGSRLFFKESRRVFVSFKSIIESSPVFVFGCRHHLFYPFAFCNQLNGFVRSDPFNIMAVTLTLLFFKHMA